MKNETTAEEPVTATTYPIETDAKCPINISFYMCSRPNHYA